MKARILAPENRKWWTLAALSFALFMIMLDNTVVNVALPSIQRDLGIGISELEWVVTAYALSFAVFLLTGGKLADRYGRRRVFLIGLIDLHALVARLRPRGRRRAPDRRAGRPGRRRGADDAGHALDHLGRRSRPASAAPRSGSGRASRRWRSRSARSSAAFSPRRRTGTGSSSSTSPSASLGFVAAFILVPESRDKSAVQRLDLPGLITAGVAVFALTYALIEGNTLRLDVGADPRRSSRSSRSRSAPSSCSSCASGPRCWISRSSRAARSPAPTRWR